MATATFTLERDTEIFNLINQEAHRQEFGIDRGMWWNEKGTQLAYYRKDETMVANYPLTNWNEREAINKDIKSPTYFGDDRRKRLRNIS